jgi:Domain of unknown function (DUF4145)
MAKFALTNPNVLQLDNGTRPLLRQSDVLTPIPLRCPHCRAIGSFAVIGQQAHYEKASSEKKMIPFTDSLRICPNPRCSGLVLVVEESGRVVRILPAPLLDFSVEHLPTTCQETLIEAVTCHAAGAYRAAAMMVRRLLEEICADNNAQRADLHKRLEALKGLVVLPQALFDAMGELKALGNDAAHVEKAYDNIRRDEAEDSIQLAKEILKALYQLQGLVSRLQARKAPKRR